MLRDLTWIAAKNTNKPPIRPTSIQGNMSQRVVASDVSVPEEEDEKKSLTHLVLAVECRVADMIIHAVATANTEIVVITCSVI
jgi:hypothetical protein